MWQGIHVRRKSEIYCQGCDILLNTVLIQHDLSLIRAELGKLAHRRADLLSVLLGLPCLFLFARAWANQLPAARTPWFVLTAACASVAMALVLLTARLAYHRADGIVASAAQQTQEQIHFAVLIGAGGALIGPLLALSLGLFAPVHWLIGMGLGLALGSGYVIMTPLVRRFLQRIALPTDIGLREIGRPLVVLGLTSVGLGLLSCILPREWAAGLAVTTGLLAMAFTGKVDAEIVRFLSLTGHSSGSILRIHLTYQLVSLVPFVFTASAAKAWLPAAIAGMFAVLLPVITTMRVLAYLSFGRTVAGWVVAILVGICAFVTISFPPAAPVLVIATVAWLARRAKPRTWLLP